MLKYRVTQDTNSIKYRVVKNEVFSDKCVCTGCGRKYVQRVVYRVTKRSTSTVQGGERMIQNYCECTVWFRKNCNVQGDAKSTKMYIQGGGISMGIGYTG